MRDSSAMLPLRGYNNVAFFLTKDGEGKSHDSDAAAGGVGGSEGGGSPMPGFHSQSQESVFGSLSWSSQNLLGTLGMGTRRGGVFSRAASAQGKGLSSFSPLTARGGARGRQGGGEGLGAQEEVEVGLVGGLRPLRDRFLVGALWRLNEPILQMFPEMEGYTGARICVVVAILLVQVLVAAVVVVEW